jgi:hypothetical protein
MSKLAEARSRTKTTSTRILYLAKGAFDVRLRPRIVGLSEEGFEPCFKKEGGKLIPIIVRETPGSIIIRVEPVMREGF